MIEFIEKSIGVESLAAIFVFCVFAFFAWKSRRNSTLFAGLLSAGAVLADLVLLHGIDDKAAVPMQLLQTFQMGTLNADYDGLGGSLAGGTASLCFRLVFYVFAIVTPLVFAGFLLSFFKSLYDEVRFFFENRFRDVYVFSEVNERAFDLARDIKAHEKQAMIVFCQNELEDSALVGDVHKSNFLLLKKNIAQFAAKTERKRYFFAICDNEEKNFQIAQELILEYQKIKFEQSENPNKVKILVQNENLLPQLAMDSRPKDLKTVTVVFINKSEAAANELLFKKPLYIACDKNQTGAKNINVLIVGTTPCADKILRLALSLSQMGDGFNSKFIIADKDALAYRERLLLEAPELFLPEYKIEFHAVDIETNSFAEFLGKHCADVNYVAVCAANDDLNFKIAIYLRSYFIRSNPKEERKPFIGVHLQNVDRETVEGLRATKNEEYELFAFGRLGTIFSYELLVNSELENLALNVHACYSFDKNSEKQKSVKSMLQSYNRSETDRKSNRANAVHIKYKLYVLGYEMKLKALALPNEIEQSKIFAEELAKKLCDKATLDFIAKIEHLRWNAHERSDGWVHVSKEDAILHKEKTKVADVGGGKYNGTHKFNIAKMHPCLCSWQELDDVGKFIGGNPEMYKEYDRQICEFLPSILGLVNNNAINISGVEYILTK